MSSKDREQQEFVEARRAEITKRSRYKLKIPLTLEILEGADPELGSYSTGRFTTRDISMAGLSISTDWPFRVGDRVQLVLRFPGKPDVEATDSTEEEHAEPEPILIEVSARVVRVELRRSPYVGLEFLKLTTEQSDRLKQLLKPTFKVKY